MNTFNLENQSVLPRDILFKISTDVSNFHKILPKYFKSLEIIDDTSKKIVIEKINFLGQSVKIKTKHIIIPPDTHKVFILTGLLRGTSFIEKYSSSPTGTIVEISVTLKLNGILRLFPFLKKLLIKRMNAVMNEFILSSENYSKTESLFK